MLRRAIWRDRSRNCCAAHLVLILRLAITKGKAAHVRELFRPMAEQGDASVDASPCSAIGRKRLLQALNDEPSFLFLAVKVGHVEVVRALLEVGGRELATMTRDNGFSCLYISAENEHLDVVRALLEAGGREIAMMTRDEGGSCLMVSAVKGHLDMVRALLEAGGREC
jgi:ankyrin repeat protein